MPHNRGEVLKGEPVPNYLVSPGASVNLKVAAGGEHYGDFPSVRTGCLTNAPGTMIYSPEEPDKSEIICHSPPHFSSVVLISVAIAHRGMMRAGGMMRRICVLGHERSRSHGNRAAWRPCCRGDRVVHRFELE
jgi:hypothetical protein